MTIHQEVTINAGPEKVYEVLTSAEKFSQMTGGQAASISTDAGGEVSLFDGNIQARNVELVPGRRVVQAWRSGNWPEGVHSIVRFELAADGGKTNLTFDQAGHPGDATEMLEDGWHKMYWEPMNALLKQP